MLDALRDREVLKLCLIYFLWVTGFWGFNYWMPTLLKDVSAWPNTAIGQAFAVAMGQQIPFDESGNHLGNSLMDYFLPTAMETPHWETDHTVTPCPHHPIGAKGVAESPHVGGIPCFSNAVIDAFAHLGVTHMDMPHSAYRVWQKCNELGLNKR